jgi:hypothetical protein
MLRKLVGAMVVMSVCLGIALADEIMGTILKVDGNKITFKSKDQGEKTYTVADNVKVVKAKFDKDTKSVTPGDPIEGGLKAEMFSNLGEKGKKAQIVTSGDKVTEIRVMGGKGKKNQ